MENQVFDLRTAHFEEHLMCFFLVRNVMRKAFHILSDFEMFDLISPISASEMIFWACGAGRVVVS